MELRVAVLGVLALLMLSGCAGGGPGATTSSGASVGTSIPDTPPPDIAWKRDDSLDRLSVLSVSEGATWDRLKVKVTSCVQQGSSSTVIYLGLQPAPYYNDDAYTNGAALNEPMATGTACGAAKEQDVSGTKDPILVDQRLNMCAGPANLPARARDVIVELWDKPSAKRILQHQFSDIAVCAS